MRRYVAALAICIIALAGILCWPACDSSRSVMDAIDGPDASTSDAHKLGATNMAVAIFTSSGTWTAPPGVFQATIVGCGSGGGGGAGGAGIASGGGLGGGGGADGPLAVCPVTVIPGRAYTVTVGAAAAGGVGVAGGNGGSGTAGNLSSFVDATTSNILCQFNSGSGGQGGGVNPATAAVFGGLPYQSGGNVFDTATSKAMGAGGAGGIISAGTGVGGAAGSTWAFQGGNVNATTGAYTGGAAGTGGSGSGSGSGGGGGACGAFGNGAPGGTGGSNAPLPGANASSASANTCAGGGGGGGGGYNSGSGHTSDGGNGGAGGTGYIEVRFSE